MLFRLKIQSKKLTIKNIKYKKRQAEQAEISCSSDVKNVKFWQSCTTSTYLLQGNNQRILNKHQKLTI